MKNSSPQPQTMRGIKITEILFLIFFSVIISQILYGQNILKKFRIYFFNYQKNGVIKMKKIILIILIIFLISHVYSQDTAIVKYFPLKLEMFGSIGLCLWRLVACLSIIKKNSESMAR